MHENRSSGENGLLAATPDELIANLPGLLGFYPEESFVVQGYYSKPDGSVYIGPTVRVDLSDDFPSGEIARYLANAQCAFHVGFIVSDRAVGNDHEYSGWIEKQAWFQAIQQADAAGKVPLMGCWLVDETREGARYRLLFGVEVLYDEITPTIWRTGTVGSVVASPAMHPWSLRNELPSLTRQEAFAYLLGDDTDSDEEQRTARTREIQRRVNRSSSVDANASSDATALLNGLARNDVTTEELLSEEEIIDSVGIWMSRTVLRDEVIGVMLDAPEAAKNLLIAAVRSLSGELRANALATLALVFLELGRVLSASQALTVALHEQPSHNLSQLLFAAVSSGMHYAALDAVKCGLLDENER
ncbi:DUF4192 domain-containing protein [Corynebacterium pseudodiphtheriticum]|uniref:DUF4192 domain-containing protein n=1 Tax=Corynebacterium pseudodiphtheriticum TaxID=37637 RepID=A0AAP4BQ19_9CORY|nr:DUF4192 domain-containing protein [Corynebacterium pseudodiphtheriticum]MCT1634641.1 DUF4192 domain-containing protein [Corynebacterium pseudodiphtheriticum]MCT1665736.1 DUF4192 domain-containing protein [Corynebacterium pseudodiphtheriticum]MDC7068495.1 DUF4192 domain-containing protein [Corynebacterium pseudodiphtheriticum]MDC7084561.1 DUF4192 domain-containing protein [Corynebacterium pseudodiphtheriticum]MDC7086338.1 DUF4192 domain-containing protein [Corynebacterium pseudodiphtheriticu